MANEHLTTKGRLAGKVAIVTGASQGIGAGIAKRLGAEGADVVVNFARRAENAQRVVDEIGNQGGRACAIQADVSRPNQIETLVEKTVEVFGGVDILVNNAGIYEFAELASVTPESIDRMFDLNVKGLILVTQAVAKMFPPAGGVVVNISSGAGATPIAFGPVYGATKAAVDNLTRAFALELGARNIRVVGIAPGAVETEGSAELSADVAPFIARTPLGRIGRPIDIATAVAFAVSDDAGWVTGETLQVAGGMRL